jgi:hypothetical protein
MKQEELENRGGSYGELCVFGEDARFGISRMRQPAEGTRKNEQQAGKDSCLLAAAAQNPAFRG